MRAPDERQAALEAALLDDPDDLATHAAYADWLMQQGDPRGEFIQVQLALEDAGRPAEERAQLRRREQELLAAHEREWLGELAPLLLGTPAEQRAIYARELDPRYGDRLDYTTADMHFKHGWARGWLDRFECGNLTVGMARTLGRAPIARLLRALVCRGDEAAGVYRYAPASDVPENRVLFRACEVLAHYPAVRNLRVFQYGREVDPEEDEFSAGTQFDRLAPLVGSMPRLEELYILGYSMGDDPTGDMARLVSLPSLTNLRIFQNYHGHPYALDRLAANPALGRLTHLLCFPHSYAQEYNPETETYSGSVINRAGVRAVVTSPHLTSLTHLQARCCDGGDDMIADIVASGALGRLKMLDLRHGLVTDAGAQLLAASPDARHMETLDLVNNRLTAAGIAALEAAGVAVRADRQQTPPYQHDVILYYGDSE